ncbi:BrnT family toxin [Desulfobacterales bacterium HSG2]|nr:BrnT family toxin [Desulfobacterales bacterium HSG2]
MRFNFDKKKSEKLRKNPKRKIGFEEATEIWEQPYYEDRRSDDPEQFRAIGWVRGRLYSVIYEVREDDEGEYCHLVTLWRSTRQEERLYERNS